MSEILFIVDLLLNEKMDESLRTKLLTRISEIEKKNSDFTVPTIPFMGDGGTIYDTTCHHEYPATCFDIISPPCKKCGHTPLNNPPYVVTSGVTTTSIK